MPTWRVSLYGDGKVLIETRVDALNVSDAIEKACIAWRELERVELGRFLERGTGLQAERLE